MCFDITVFLTLRQFLSNDIEVWNAAVVWFIVSLHLLLGSEGGGEDALVGNVNKLMMSPPGCSGAPRKGHLVFDACFESGEYSSPVGISYTWNISYHVCWFGFGNIMWLCSDTHVARVILLYTVYHQPLWRSGSKSCPLSYFIISLEFIYIRVTKFVLWGQTGKHLTRQHYASHRYNSPQHMGRFMIT